MLVLLAACGEAEPFPSGRLVDLTHTFDTDAIYWPTSPGFEIETLSEGVTERGYHLELWEPSVMPGAAFMIASGKFVATPMDGRLRLAGIVEATAGPAPAARTGRGQRSKKP